jgi:hypothetical protein
MRLKLGPTLPDRNFALHVFEIRADAHASALEPIPQGLKNVITKAQYDVFRILSRPLARETRSFTANLGIGTGDRDGKIQIFMLWLLDYLGRL